MNPEGRPRRWLRRTALAGLAALLLIQLVPVDRSNPAVIADVGAPPEVDRILRRSCYDCHSHETRWPWYARVAPASWFLADHVHEGRGDLNFSDWPTFDLEGEFHNLEEIAEQIEKGEMPLTSYLLLHPSARLSEEDKHVLLEWAGTGELEEHD